VGETRERETRASVGFSAKCGDERLGEEKKSNHRGDGIAGESEEVLLRQLSKDDLDSQSKKPNPEVEAGASNALGEVLANEGKATEAQAAYDSAAKLNPASAAMYFTNEAIIMDRAGQVDGTVAAADKAIAADPTKPVPYYLKGKALINKATVDQKTGKIIAPPGCADAYQKYLELAPDGPFAPEVKSVLQEMGETIKSNYKAGKKS